MSSDPARQASGSTLFTFSPTPDPNWLLVEDGLNLAREHEVESLFTVANGYIGTRGSLAEGSALSAPATYVAGVFDVEPQGSVPELAVAPDWMQLRVRVDEAEVGVEAVETLEHRRTLDMCQGMLWREWRFQDANGRVTRLRGFRLASLADRHLLLQSILFTPENYSSRIHLETRLIPPPVRPGQVSLLPEAVSSTTKRIGVVQRMRLRTGKGVRVALAAVGQLNVKGNGWTRPAGVPTEHGGEFWEVDIDMGVTYRLDRLVLVYTSRETDKPTQAAAKQLERAYRRGLEALIEDHRRVWAERWRWADVVVEGHQPAQRAMRFACYHLVSSANPEDERVSIGARALTGPGYKGHVFWDTEIFMLPFYVFTDPAAARALLMYRYWTLPAARERARGFGYAGALYAWESADTGEETTPTHLLSPDGEIVPVLSGVQEHHISADVAYGVWQYWCATGDDAFFLEAGAEILFETARFWASRGCFGEDGRYHIETVVGPDEYHEGVDDNAYTNGMAQWNLEQAVQAAELLRTRWPEHWSALSQRLDIDDAELGRWEDVARSMHLGLDEATGLLEQFRGYFALQELDLTAYAPRSVPVDVLLGRSRVQRSQVVKQADVLMLIYLLWERFSPAMREANFRYYEPRTAHGSSLSPAVHAAVAARLGYQETAARYFHQAAEIDLSNNMGNAAGGVHAAALGGLWQAAVLGFGGLHLLADGLALRPRLPAVWEGLRFAIGWRGRRVSVAVRADTLEIGVTGEAPVPVTVGEGGPVDIAPGRRRHWRCTAEGAWKEIPT